jgi:predicted XRE-type DNA-binding protein
MASKEEVTETTVVHSSGNVFSDLGLPRPEERLAKAKLASAIQDAIDVRGLTQVQAAELMGIDQPKVSKIVRGRLSEFSTERLLNFLIRLGIDIDIVIHTKSRPAHCEGSISIAYV